ncbi:MAG: hypothetical protein WDO16_18415 [Bacteroidota bacterium]
MKKQLFISLFSICMAAVLLSSCKQKGGSGEAYTLKMRLSKGDKFGQEMDMDMKMQFEMMGQNMSMNMNMLSGTAFEVTGAAAEAKELTLTYTKMNMSMEMKGADGKTQKMGDQNAGEKIIGKKVVMKINDKMKSLNQAALKMQYGATPQMQQQESK